MHHVQFHADVVIVGGGPAGSAAAIAALRERPDARVILFDRAPIGRDKVCGDGIAPHAVAELEALGVTGVFPGEHVDAVRLSAPNGTSDSAVTASPGYVVRRAAFDERLLLAAIDAGAHFVQEKVSSLECLPGDVVVNGWAHAPVVIGADGSTSAVRRLTGHSTNTGSALAVAIRGYAPTPRARAKELEIRWDSRRAGGLCYAWAFPLGDGTTNIGYGMSASAVSGGRAELVERMGLLLPEFELDGVELTGHTLPLTISRPPAATGRTLLVGDAASLINPFTGEGIYSAIASGVMAGRAAIRHPNSAGRQYRRELADRFRGQHRQLRLLYPLIDSPAVLDTVIRACRNDRRMFDRLLEVGLGNARFSVLDAVRLARHRPQSAKTNRSR